MTGKNERPCLSFFLPDSEVREIARNVYNVFEDIVAAEHTEIGHIKSVLQQSGALCCQMTGSGSVVFGIMPDQSAAELAVQRLKETYSQVFLAEPV